MERHDRKRPNRWVRVLRSAPRVGLALGLAACTTGHDGPWGVVDFSAAPEGLRTARLLGVDGREAGDGNPTLHLDAGPHSILVADAANPGGPGMTFSVDVEADRRQFVALREAPDGSLEAIVWKREPL